MDIFINEIKFELAGNAGRAEHHRKTETTPGVVETKIYTLEEFKKCKDIVKAGDGVKLPKITIEGTTIKGGGEDMEFDRMEIQDTARVIKKENGKIDFVFQHCLFESAIDCNSIDGFDATQLGKYLSGAFLEAMKAAGIPAAECGLLSRDEVFGDDAPPFFKDGRNRIAFDLEENETWCYWLSTRTSSAYFCRVNYLGYSAYGSASDAHTYVRPRFAIE